MKVTECKEISEAIQRTAFSAQTAGTSFQDLSAYITTVSEKTRRSSDVIGESFKSIYSRYQNVKLGSLDDEGKSINDIEKALGRVGIQIRDINGDFRDFDDVLKEFAKKSKSMSQVDFLGGVNALAGSRQKESLLALIKNFDQVEKHQQSIADATGNAKRMFDETYSESLDAKVQDLKRSFENLYGTILSSNALGGGATFLTGVVSGIDGVIQKFGLLSPLIVTVGTLMLSTSKGFGDFIKKSQSMLVTIADGNTTLRNELGRTFNVIRDGSTGAITKVNALGMSFDIVKLKAVAMQTAFSLGISLLVAGVVSLVSHLANASKELKSFNDSYASSNGTDNSIVNAEKLVQKYKALQGELANLEKGTEQYKAKEQELADTQSKIIELYPQSSSAISDNTDAKSLNLEATEKLIEKDKELAKSKANEVLHKNRVDDAKDIDKTIKKYQEYYDEIEKFNAAKDRGMTDVYYMGTSMGVDVAISKATKKYEEQKSILNALLPAVKLLEESNPKLAGTYDLIAQSLGVATEELNKNTQAQAENAITPSSDPRSKSEVLQSATKEIEVKTVISDTTKSELIALFPEYEEIFVGADVSEAKEKIKELQDIEIEAKVKADGLSELEQFLTKIGASADNSKKIIDSFNKSIEDGVSVSQSLQRSYGTVYSDAANSIEDLVKMQKELNKEKRLTPDIIEQIVNKYPEMIDSMGSVGDLQKAITSGLKEQESVAKEAYLNMMSNSESFFKNNIKNSQSWVNTQASVNTILMNLHKTMLNTNAKNYNGYYKSLAESYSQDINNSKTVAQSKIAIESNLLKAMTDAWATYYETQRVAQQIQASGMENWISQAPGGSEYLESLKQQAIAEKQKAEALKQAYEQAKNALNGFNFKVPDISGGTIGGGSGGGDGSGGGSSEDNYKATIDRYRQQQLELEKINKLLELNDILSQSANSKDKVRLAQERIELLKKQKAALEALNAEQKKELSETKSAIQKYGGTFDSNGNLTNYQQVLAKYTGESAKALESLINKYDDLNDKISDTGNQVEDIKNATIDAYNAIGDELKKQWEKETDALKSEIEKRKDALNKQKDDEDYEDQRFEAQKKLTDLQQKRAEALRAGNMSEVNKLDEEIRQAQKELNDLIRDKEFDNSNNRFDEEIDKLDKDLEDKIAAMEKEIENGNLMEYIKKNGIDLTTVFDDVNNLSKSVNSNMMTIGTSIDSWTDSLNTFKSNLANIQSSLTLGLKSSVAGGVSKTQGTTINSPLISLTVQGDGATVVNEDRIRYLLDEYSSKILNQINDIY